ncbi:hypothetical protein [Cerasicoccus frondis]|uniref:hypothetical protein n=1 Tax=Cerasicoccus frondis TaxID=490090 RepID=UPI002852C5F6|nr:hypothetical protein [Cerasicoccus frondis]
MNSLSRKYSPIYFGLLLLTASATANANTLMIDFGPTTVTGADLTNSPYHTENSEYTGTSWNHVESTDVTSGVLWGDGASADGVGINVGRSSFLNEYTLTFAGAPNSFALGSQLNTGVFSDTSVGKDGNFYTKMTGVLISGLSAGDYEIYVVGANTNLSASDGAAMGFWAISTDTTANIDATPYLESTPQATSTNTIVSSWVEGSNYAKLTITLTEENPYLVLFVTGTTLTEDKGYLNAIQISSIPEPEMASIGFGIAILGLVLVKRRVRHSRQ